LTERHGQSDEIGREESTIIEAVIRLCSEGKENWSVGGRDLFGLLLGKELAVYHVKASLSYCSYLRVVGYQNERG
jgi:hypothetical protein